MHHKIGGYVLAVTDLLTALVVVFAAMAVLAVIAAKKDAKAGVHPGTLIVTLHWDLARDADVDLWLKAPGDDPVGFSNRTSKYCDLLRDDLGRAMDPSSTNFEMIVCRKTPPGAYVVDVMAYRSYDHAFPIGARVEVKRLGAGGVIDVLDRRLDLAYQGEQLTVWRFSLDAHGALVAGSVGCIPLALYASVPAECTP